MYNTSIERNLGFDIQRMTIIHVLSYVFVLFLFHIPFFFVFLLSDLSMHVILRYHFYLYLSFHFRSQDIAKKVGSTRS